MMAIISVWKKDATSFRNCRMNRPVSASFRTMNLAALRRSCGMVCVTSFHSHFVKLTIAFQMDFTIDQHVLRTFQQNGGISLITRQHSLRTSIQNEGIPLITRQHSLRKSIQNEGIPLILPQ